MDQIPIRPEDPRLAPGKWSQVLHRIRRLEVSPKNSVHPRPSNRHGILVVEVPPQMIPGKVSSSVSEKAVSFSIR